MSRNSFGVIRGGPLEVVSILDGTTALQPEVHANKLLLLSDADASYIINLPRALGTGDVYTFLLGIAMTSGSVIINASAVVPSNYFVGQLWAHTSADTLVQFASTANDIITLNRTTTGAAEAGDSITVVDAAPNVWRVLDSLLTTSGAQATAFSG